MVQYEKNKFRDCFMHGEKFKNPIRGGKNIKQIQIGYGSYIQVGQNASLMIGDSFVNREVKIICNQSITIGDECIIAMGTVIRDNDGGAHKILSDDYVNSKPIVIHNHVWIGENVMILKGVTIGEGAVVGANLLVQKMYLLIAWQWALLQK